jgi:hypothetical protein
MLIAELYVSERNLHYFIIYLATLPVTTSSAERSFGALKYMNTYCHSTHDQKLIE